MSKPLTETEIKKRLTRLRNLEDNLYPAARARIAKLETEVKDLKLEKQAAEERELGLHSLIQKLQLQVEMLNAKVFGKKHRHKNKDKDKDKQSKNSDGDSNSDDQSNSGNSDANQTSSKPPRSADSYRRRIPDESEITDQQYHGVDTSNPAHASHSAHADHILGEHKTFEFMEEDIILPSSVSLKTVTKHTVQAVFCKSCGLWLYGKDIPGQPVTVGENLSMLVSFLSTISRFSYQQIIEHVDLFYRIKLTDGLIAGILRDQAAKLRPAYESLIESILQQSGVHFDESSWKMLIEKLGNYVWVMTGTDNRDAAFFFGQSRGKKVLTEKMLAPLQRMGDKLGDKAGMLTKKIIGISDDYNGYRNVEAFLAHALCWAHPNRKLRDLAESKTLPEKTRSHCEKVYKQFNTIYLQVNNLWNADITEEKRDKERKKLEKQFDRVARPHSKDPPELKTYKDSLKSNKECYFVCLKYPNIPPDNNKAERALRHLVIKRKACGGSKTQQGADVLSVLYSTLLSLYWREPKDFFGEYSKLLDNQAWEMGAG